MKTVVVFSPAILIFAIYGILTLVFYLQRKYRKMKGYRSPFTDNFLRSPGESLNKQIMEISDKMTEHIVMCITAPILFYALYMSSSSYGTLKFSVSVITVLVITGTGFIAYHLFRLIKLTSLRQSYRLGYEGEIAVGQELNRLMRDGYYVYHDFPAKNFNIDHIVVGASGVFAVETKARSKMPSNNSNIDYKVTYDGNRLHFPKGTDFKSIQQAKGQAAWLSKWLKNAVGEAVTVRPVLALPGWFVNRNPSSDVLVINHKECGFIAKVKNGKILSKEMISRVVHQLEQKCRDVEPKASQ